MKINYLIYTTIISAVLCLSACKDDDHHTTDGGSGEDSVIETDDIEASDLEDGGGISLEEEGEALSDAFTGDDRLMIQQKVAVTSVFTALTGVTDIQENFTSASYEPVYGENIDPSDPQSRAVVCTATDEAEKAFRSLSGGNLVTATADGCEISLRGLPILEGGKTLDFGKLTFHRGDGAREMGFVVVDIPCVPNLKQIQYLAPDAMPTVNGGNSPYELGDLVYLPKGNKYCQGYYLCVRKPTNGVGGLLVHLCINDPSDEAINLDGDNEGCWYPYNRSQGMKTESGHVEAYISFILENKALVANLKYYLDGKIIGRKPTLSGKKDNIFPQGFGNEDGYVFKSDDGRGARIRYEARFGEYNWVPAYYDRISYYWYLPNYCDSWRYVEDKTYTYVYDSDWNKHYGQYWNYTMNVITFRDGSPVSGAKIEYSPTNDDLQFANSADFVSQEHLGCIYASDHRIYETVGKARAAGVEPVGVIVYVNDGSDFGNQATEKDEGYGHALVLALSNISGNPSLKWSPDNEPIAEIDDFAFTQYVSQKTGAASALSDFGGLIKTMQLADMESPAALAAQNYSVKAPVPKCSKWFLPSAAQWLAMLCKPGLGGMPMPTVSAAFPTYVETNATQAFKNINERMKGSGVYTIGAAKYWSSSAYNESNGVYLTGLTYGTRLTYWSNTTAKVRAVLVF